MLHSQKTFESGALILLLQATVPAGNETLCGTPPFDEPNLQEMIGSHVPFLQLLSLPPWQGALPIWSAHRSLVEDDKRPHLGKLTRSAPDATPRKSADGQQFENEKAAIAYREAAQAILNESTNRPGVR